MRLLILLLLGYFVYRMFRGSMAPKLAPKEKDTATVAHQDPVCGVYVPENQAVVGRMGEKRFYFCSTECLKKFEKDQTKR